MTDRRPAGGYVKRPPLTPEESEIAHQVAAPSARAVRDVRRFALVAFADRVASCWWAVGLAAERDEAVTAAAHCRDLVVLSREAFALIRALYPEIETEHGDGR